MTKPIDELIEQAAQDTDESELLLRQLAKQGLDIIRGVRKIPDHKLSPQQKTWLLMEFRDACHEELSSEDE